MDNTDPYKTKFKEERLYMSTNQNLMQHMRELIDRIKAADVAYYRDDNPTMTDREYDLLVDELKELETTTGLILSGSPTQTVSGEILKELTPVRHTKPMLSADKTKSIDEMLRFANGRPVVLSWKLDGLTLVLRYEGGEFKQAITRGREGIIGEDVTHTVRTFMNVPMCIPCADKFEVRGEGVISWAHFEKLNLSLSEPYSHPRNLAAGSVRMLDLSWEKHKLKQLDASIEIQEEVVRKNNTLRLGIYEDLRAGLLDRSEYESLKKELAERIDEATAAIEKLNKEKREILDGVSKQQSWVEQFRQYENVTELTRPMVIHLIERINIFEDSNIEIVFRHRNQIEEILQFISEKTANKKVLAMPIREVG